MNINSPISSGIMWPIDCPKPVKKIQMKKLIIETVKEFLNFRACCEKERIKFEYWSKPGGRYIVEANEKELEVIGY